MIFAGKIVLFDLKNLLNKKGAFLCAPPSSK
jgi:hypothetical protein